MKSLGSDDQRQRQRRQQDTIVVIQCINYQSRDVLDFEALMMPATT
jgi:hypothetical protein